MVKNWLYKKQIAFIEPFNHKIGAILKPNKFVFEISYYK